MKISEAIAALMVAAAVGIAAYLPSPQNPPALVHQSNKLYCCPIWGGSIFLSKKFCELY